MRRDKNFIIIIIIREAYASLCAERMTIFFLYFNRSGFSFVLLQCIYSTSIRNIAGHLQKNALEMAIVLRCLNEMGIEPKADKCYKKTSHTYGVRERRDDSPSAR